MADPTALRLAIDLIRVPSRVRLARAESLPAGMPLLLRIAAGEEEAEREAFELTGLPRNVVAPAAKFFIEQVLLCPQSDSYRVLGADRQATTAELRRNMALLLRWLHPDLEKEAQPSVFVTRITSAWNDLKTAERRALFDQINPPSGSKSATAGDGGGSAKSRKRGFSKRLSGGSRPNGSCRVGSARPNMAFDPRGSAKPKFGYGHRKKPSLLRRAFMFLLGEARQ